MIDVYRETRSIPKYMSLNQGDLLDIYERLQRHVEVGKADMINFLKSPLPKELGTVKLTIIRKKGIMNRLCPKYYLYNMNRSVFLINAKRIFAAKTPYYTMSAEYDEFGKDSGAYVGKLRGSERKSVYTLYDDGGELILALHTIL